MFNSQLIKEDLTGISQILFAMFVILVGGGWLLTGFGLGVGLELYSTSPWFLWGIIIFDLGLFILFIYDRYFKIHPFKQY